MCEKIRSREHNINVVWCMSFICVGRDEPNMSHFECGCQFIHRYSLTSRVTWAHNISRDTKGYRPEFCTVIIGV